MFEFDYKEGNPFELKKPINNKYPQDQQSNIDDSDLTLNPLELNSGSLRLLKEILKEEEIYKNQKEKFDKTIIGRLFRFISFSYRYILASSVIFSLLLLGSNFSAYKNMVLSYLNPNALINTNSSMLASLNYSRDNNLDFDLIMDNMGISNEYNSNSLANTSHSMELLTSSANYTLPTSDINIVPFENRVVIPKIGKNIPLLNVKTKDIINVGQLEDVFMEELKSGVVRYPGSTLPGQNGNTFIFGHSSNLPWIKSDYNDVFALLGNLEEGDEIVVYYGQKKYTYKISTKRVIHPSETDILYRDEGKDELTLMTCWPVGTTQNRLIVIGELIETS